MQDGTQQGISCVLQAPAPVLMERAETLQELWNGFNTTRVAYLDLKKMDVAAECGLTAVGPHACLAGDLHLVPGQYGTSSQASLLAATAPNV